MSLYVEQRDPMLRIIEEVYELRDNFYVTNVTPDLKESPVELEKRREMALREAIERAAGKLEEMTAAPKKRKKKIRASGNSNSNSNADHNNSASNSNNEKKETTTIPSNPEDQSTLSIGGSVISNMSHDKTLRLLLQPSQTIHMTRQQRSFFFYCLGHLYNALPTYHPWAEQFLGKAVKADPYHEGAWNSLGESYWKKGNVVAAELCFRQALEYIGNSANVQGDENVATALGSEAPVKRGNDSRPRVQSLRNLSMIFRHLEKSHSKIDKVDSANESLRLAKEALSLDFEDGLSWYNLGTSYLFVFFSPKRTDSYCGPLFKALQAYNKATTFKVNTNNADLYYNQSIVLLYLGRYQESFDSLLRCQELDPCHGQVKKQLTLVEDQMKAIWSSFNAKRKSLTESLVSELTFPASFFILEEISVDILAMAPRLFLVQDISDTNNILVVSIYGLPSANNSTFQLFNPIVSSKAGQTPSHSNLPILKVTGSHHPSLQLTSFRSRNNKEEHICFPLLKLEDLTCVQVNGVSLDKKLAASLPSTLLSNANSIQMQVRPS